MKLRQAPGSLISNWVAIPGLETLEDWCLGSCRVVCICYVLPKCLWVQPTVDGRNPAPPWMVETCWNPINSGINHLSTGAGFLPSTVAPGVRAYFRYKREPNTTDWGSPNCHPILNLDSGFGPLQADWKVSSQKKGGSMAFSSRSLRRIIQPIPPKDPQKYPHWFVDSWISIIDW